MNLTLIEARTDPFVLGDCGQIIIIQDAPMNHFQDPETGEIASGARFTAYYIGCCDSDLNWIHTVTGNSRPSRGRIPPYVDGNADNEPFFPYYYGPPDSVLRDGTKVIDEGIINNRTDFDYPFNPYDPLHCP